MVFCSRGFGCHKAIHFLDAGGWGWSGCNGSVGLAGFVFELSKTKDFVGVWSGLEFMLAFGLYSGI